MTRPDWSSLLLQLVRRDLLRRYRGSFLGLGWTLIRPLALLLAFQFAFRLVLVAPWPGNRGEADMALQVLLGALVFQFFAELLHRAPGLLQENPDLVKKVAFPRELLGVAATLTAAVPLVVGGSLIVAVALPLGLCFPANLLQLPVFLGGLLVAGCGITWLLASTGVYLRDLRALMQLATNLLIFLSPVFYPLALVPPRLLPWVRWNPVATAIEGSRRLVLGTTGAPPIQLLGPCLVALVLALAGRWWFRRLDPGFSDVL